MRKPSEDGNWEFKLVEAGWHRITFTDGIQPNVKKQDDGTESKTLLFPFKVDEDGPDNGVPQKQYIGPWGSELGTRRIVDILNAVDLWAAFEEKFPGNDVTPWEPQIVSQIQKRVPGKSCIMRFGISRDGKFNEHLQIVSFAWAKAHDIKVGGEGTKRAPIVEGQGETKGGAGKAPAAADGWN